MTTLTNEDFNRLYRYIQTNYGIDLSKKQQLIVSRLTSSLEAEGYTDFHVFVDDIVGNRRPDLVSPMLNKLTTNYTYFLREEEHFNFLKNVILPEAEARHRGDKCLSIWSAGCSSGEEPYTISMYLKEYFGANAPQWDTRVLATDISMEVLRKAMNPTYVEESLSSLPAGWKAKYFVKRPDGTYTVNDILKKNVIFRPFNLMESIRFRKQFDLIFCRNVMIYFNSHTKDALVNRFYNATVDGGYLFIGHSEGINRATCPYKYLQPAIYKKAR